MVAATIVAIEQIPGFRVLRQIGGGGSGVVYLAEQFEPSRPVAVKVLHLPVDQPAYLPAGSLADRDAR